MKATKADYAKLFTAEELKLAKAIVESGAVGFYHDRLLEIVRPAMPRINKMTGQENDARFMAYALEWVVS